MNKGRKRIGSYKINGWFGLDPLLEQLALSAGQMMVELERMYPSDSLLSTQHFLTDEEHAECNGDGVSADIAPYHEALLDLKSRDKVKRDKALSCVASRLEQSARASDDAAAHKSLTAFLPVTVRLTLDCPFADVRERLKRILEQLKVSTLTLLCSFCEHVMEVLCVTASR